LVLYCKNSLICKLLLEAISKDEKDMGHSVKGLTLVSSCKNAPIEQGEACSITVLGVEFTKSLNHAKDLATVEESIRF
jgi:hypothetical protein